MFQIEMEKEVLIKRMGVLAKIVSAPTTKSFFKAKNFFIKNF